MDDFEKLKEYKLHNTPVPTYDEYKAMRAELAEHRYYCCCNEN